MTIAGSFTFRTCSPPSTSRTTVAASPSISTFEAKVACGQPSSAASICPVAFMSLSIACLPAITSPGASASITAFRSFATAKGSMSWFTSSEATTRIARSAPMASAVLSVSCACLTPIETATTSSARPFSFSRIASSTAISSKGFMLILTLARSTPDPSPFTRTLTLKSITRLTGTRTFIGALPDDPAGSAPWPADPSRVRPGRTRPCGQLPPRVV